MLDHTRRKHNYLASNYSSINTQHREQVVILPATRSPIYVLFPLLFVLCITQQVALAAEPPQATHLQSISEGFYAPVRIAIDAEANVYVTDTRRHRVCILDSHGNLQRYIYEVKAPLGIAVDKLDRLYVGDKQTGSVAIFTSHGSPIGKLGTGDGQFTLPTDIAIDSQNRIYVVDDVENCVKVFGEDGSYLFQFGDTILGFPTGIAIDEANNRILVGQYGEIENGKNAAKIQIFDMKGNWEKSIGKYGAKPGEFTRIQGLAVDNQGRIYVADCFQSTVQVVDYAGNGLSSISHYGTAPGQLRIPCDVVFDPYGRLWVTSTENGRIEIFGIDQHNSPSTQESGFTMNLAAGVNFISVPLRPPDQWTLGHLAAHIGDELASIVTYDREKGYALLYIPGITDGSIASMPVSGSESYIVMMREPKTITFHGAAWEGQVNLYAGPNFLAVPLQPHTEWRLSDLADHIGEELIHFVVHDRADNTFQAYVPGAASSFNVALEGGVGYIAIMSKPKTVVFEGKAWTNTGLNLAPPGYAILQSTNTPVLVMQGKAAIPHTSARPTADGAAIKITNQDTGVTKTAVVTPTGDYAEVFMDITSIDSADIAACEPGHTIQIKAADPVWVSETIDYTLTTEDIRIGHIILPTISLETRPKESVLLQNFPNPFNPDTWIPYRLRQEAEVTIEIYNVTGQLIRTLNLGRKEPGHYVSRQKAAYWDGTNEAGESVASGVYFYIMRAGALKVTRRMTILR